VGSEQLAVDGGQWTMGSGQLALNSRQWAESNEHERNGSHPVFGEPGTGTYFREISVKFDVFTQSKFRDISAKFCEKVFGNPVANF
jgi:hypothetical protein